MNSHQGGVHRRAGAPGDRRKRAAVLGSPISHSLSPVLHRAAYARLGLDWDYDAVEIDSSQLAGFLASCDESPDESSEVTWAGVSLTMPLKTIALSLMDEVDPLARLTNSVNTVVWGEGGRTGYNTDIYGMTRAIHEVQGDDTISSVALLGAGATARSAIASIHDVVQSDPQRELSFPMDVHVFARRTDAAVGLADFVGESSFAQSIRVIAQPWSDRASAFDRDLVVSTLPGDVIPDLERNLTTAPGILMDVAYDPWPTPLTRRWRDLGGRAATGDMMLLWQAAEQVRLMTGCQAPVDAMRTALVDSLRARGGGG